MAPYITPFNIRDCESGFTLIETIVVILTIGVLASLAVINFRQLKYRVTITQLQAMAYHAEIALEQGMADIEMNNIPAALQGQGAFLTWVTKSEVENPDVFHALLPGFDNQGIVPDEFTILGVFLAPDCIYEVVDPGHVGGECQWKYIVASNCRDRVAYFRDVREGLEFSYRAQFDDSDIIFGCSGGLPVGLPE